MDATVSSSTTLIDEVGTVHQQAGRDARIVCLVPSVTELICDLGLADQLVGRTGFCVHPWDTVRRIPKVGGTKDVNLGRVRELQPTHAIVNVDENLRETAEQLAEFVPNVIVTHPRSPYDNLGLFRLMGGIFDREQRAAELCRDFELALGQLSGDTHPRQAVLYLVWRDPWMAVSADTYISRTLGLINWVTHPIQCDDRYPEVRPAAYSRLVDRVLLSSEPFHFKPGHISEVESLVPGARVSLIDGEMTSWYGSRAIRGLRYLTNLT
jgi:ABC-type Fe3+-hydroxamate transport system substrate-binding protein